MKPFTVKQFKRYGFTDEELDIFVRNNLEKHDWEHVKKIEGDLNKLFSHYKACSESNWKWDKNGYPISSTAKTQIGNIEFKYEYDDEGNLIYFKTFDDEMKMQYDKNGNLLQSFLNDKLENEYQYNEKNE